MQSDSLRNKDLVYIRSDRLRRELIASGCREVEPSTFVGTATVREIIAEYCADVERSRDRAEGRRYRRSK